MIRFTTFILSIIICLSARSQDCGNYLLLKKNTTLDYTMVGTDRTGSFMVKDVKSDSNGCRATITARYPFIGKKYRESDYEVLLENNVFKLSVYGKLIGMRPAKKEKKDNNDSQEDLFIDYPSNMEVGQTFENIVADLDMANLFGKGSSKMRVSIINREVTGKETVSTPTGKYECFKITYDMGLKSIGFNTMDQKSRYTEWFAPGVGLVKFMASGGILGDESYVSVLSAVKSN
jgi:hypothetical protein